MPSPAYCCPSRPAHSRSRAFFQTAATLALIAGGLSGSLSTQAKAADYTNPLGATVGTQFFAHGMMGGGLTSFNNAGTISGSMGVLSYDNRTVISDFTNSGLIQGTSGYAIHFFDNTAVTTFNNSGTITSNSSDAIFRFDHSPITTLNNSGTISATGGHNAIGFFDNSGITTLNNSGTISATGGGHAISFFDGSITTINLLPGSVIIGGIENLGTIGTLNVYKTLASGDFNSSSMAPSISGNQPGVTNRYATINSGTTVGHFFNDFVRLNSLTNAGTITILSNSGTIDTLTNSGTMGSVNNNACTIGTLNILNGSVFSGSINNFGGTIGTLNVYKTLTSANFDIASLVPAVGGNQPGTTNLYLTAPSNCKFINVNGHAAGIDVSGFGANTDAIRHVSNSVARLANTNGVIESIGAKAAKHAAAPYAMTSDLCADGAPAPAAQVGNSDFWIRGFTGRNKVDATASSIDFVNSYFGGAVGIERDWSDSIRAGAFIGSGRADNTLGSSLGGSTTNLLFVGAYAIKTLDTNFAKIGLTAGHGNNTSNRNIAAATAETATADYDSWYVSPEASIGRVYDLGRHLGGSFSLTPVLSARYVYARQEGYTETGATNNLTMGSSSSTTFEERAELKFSYATKAFNDTGVKINASVGGIGQQNSGGAQNGTLLGAPLSFATPGQDNSTGFVGGLGLEFTRGKCTFSASGDYVRLSRGNADLSANVVFSVKF